MIKLTYRAENSVNVKALMRAEENKKIQAEIMKKDLLKKEKQKKQDQKNL